jgi:hypothetical protein
LIAIAVAGVLSAPMAASAADMMSDTKVSGFVDTFLTLTTDNAACTVATYEACEGQFTVAESEIDVEAMGVRVDVDHKSGSGNSLEQAYFSTDLGGWDLMVGQFNAGLTVDGQDAPDMMFSTPSLVALDYDAFGLTNVTGAHISGMAGPAKLRLGLVNDPTINPGATGAAVSAGDVATAVIVGASGSVMDGLDISVSMVSADADDVTDLQLNFTMEGLRLNLDYMTSDTTDVYSVMAGYDLGNGMGIKVRMDNDSPDVGNETDTVTIHFDYALTDNVALALENYAEDDGTNDWNQTTLEFIATF